MFTIYSKLFTSKKIETPYKYSLTHCEYYFELELNIAWSEAFKCFSETLRPIMFITYFSGED